MADLVALLEVNGGRLRREGEPEDGGDERPADGDEEAALRDGVDFKELLGGRAMRQEAVLY